MDFAQSKIWKFIQPVTARVGVMLFLVVGLEAVILLYVLGLGYTKLELYDYQVFERLGINLIDHATFSMEEVSPYSPTLFRSPGYPAYIALIYSLFGRSLMVLRISQFVLLWLTAWLLYVLAARFVDFKSAAMASLICATYPPFVFVSALYVAHSLTLLFAIIIILMLVSLREQLNPRLYGFLFLGLAIGGMTLARPAFQLVVFPVALATVMWRPERLMKRRLVEATVLAIGFAMVIVPWVIRNNLLSNNMAGLRVASAGGWSLYTSASQYKDEASYRILKPEWDIVVADFNRRNQEALNVIPDRRNSDGTLANPYAQAQRELLVDNGFNRDAFRKIREVTPGQFILSYVARFYWLWSTCDLSPWQVGIFHRFLQIYHVLLIGLILLGCFLTRKSLVAQALLWMFIIYQSLLHVVYHMEARYTLEARLFLLIYAGVSIVAIARYVRQKTFPVEVASVSAATVHAEGASS